MTSNVDVDTQIQHDNGALLCTDQLIYVWIRDVRDGMTAARVDGSADSEVIYKTDDLG